MIREVSVLIVEDDFFSRIWMEMLLRRDWRTRVFGVVGNRADLVDTLRDLSSHHERIDVILVDTEVPNNDGWLKEIMQVLERMPDRPTIIFISAIPHLNVVEMLNQSSHASYVIKDEIRFALAWAVVFAVENHVVLTPSTFALIPDQTSIKPGTIILDGRNSITDFSQRETEAARLAFLFSMERRDLADEMMISEEYSYGLISTLYEKMGLNDILQGEVALKDYFDGQPMIQEHFEKAIDFLRQGKGNQIQGKTGHQLKNKDKETLAYHLLTMPIIEVIH